MFSDHFYIHIYFFLWFLFLFLSVVVQSLERCLITGRLFKSRFIIIIIIYPYRFALCLPSSLNFMFSETSQNIKLACVMNGDSKCLLVVAIYCISSWYNLWRLIGRKNTCLSILAAMACNRRNILATPANLKCNVYAVLLNVYPGPWVARDILMVIKKKGFQ